MVKIREGFVSNSSSSSFIIKKESVPDDEVQKTVKVLKLLCELDEYDGEFIERTNCYQVYLGYGVEGAAVELAGMLGVKLVEGYPDED